MNNSNFHTHTLPVIGYHHSPMPDKFGIPRQPNLVALPSCIRFVPPYGTPAAFDGIGAFSHLWILWHFHKNSSQATFRPQVRPPRLGGNDKTGVFATRSMYRPSQIGLSVVQFDRLEIIDNQAILHIIGADMADGTPIFDIKPYLGFVDSVAGATSLDKPTFKPVIFGEQAEQDFENFQKNQILTNDDKALIQTLIAQDPRPAYRQNDPSVFVMRYKAVDVGFWQKGDTLVIEFLKCVIMTND